MTAHENDSCYTAKMIGPSLRSALAGEEGAQEHFWSLFYTVVSRCGRVVGSRYRLGDIRIDDIIQTCLCQHMEFLRKDPESLLDVNNWQAWLYTRLTWLACDQVRAMRRTDSLDQTFIDRDDSPTPYEFIGSSEETPENLITRRQLQEKVENHIAAISDPHRRRVFLLYMQGYSYLEIAEATGVSMDTLTTWIYRTKTAMIAALATHG